MLGNGIEAFRVLQGITVPCRAAIHRIARCGFGPLAKPVLGHRPLAGGKRAVVQRDDRGEAGQAGRRASDALGDGYAASHGSARR
jgi:hypothetical protein